jgi:hypothetical protein
MRCARECVWEAVFVEERGGRGSVNENNNEFATITRRSAVFTASRTTSGLSVYLREREPDSPPTLCFRRHSHARLDFIYYLENRIEGWIRERVERRGSAESIAGGENLQ